MPPEGPLDLQVYRVLSAHLPAETAATSDQLAAAALAVCRLYAPVLAEVERLREALVQVVNAANFQDAQLVADEALRVPATGHNQGVSRG